MENKIIDLCKILYPQKYQTDYIYTYCSFDSELRELIDKSGYAREFKVKYYKSLRFLEQLKRKCVLQSKLFEKLLNSDGIYSIRLMGEKNIRILFSFHVIEKREVVVLYNCFQEKRTSDYTAEINLARKRRDELFDIWTGRY